jgi:hypothetical protein
MSPDKQTELVGVAEEMLLDVIRDESLIPFHKEYLGQYVCLGWAKSKAGGEDLSEAVNRANFVEACQRVNARFLSFEAKPHNFMNSDSFWGVHLSPRPDQEWVDVLREVHGTTAGDPARVLTYSATQMMERVESGEFTRGFLSEQSVRHRIRRFGYRGFDDVIRELEVKCGLKLGVEKKLDTKAKYRRQMLKFRVVSRSDVPPSLCPQAPNPVFRYSGEPAGVHLAFKRFLQQQLIELGSTGVESLRLWAFDSWKSYWRCFPDRGNGEGKYPNGLGDLLQGCVVHPKVKLEWNLGGHDYVWTVNCSVSRPWSAVLAEIQGALAEPDVIAKYGLSAEAANLLRWVFDQPKASLLLGCTPILEDAIRKNQVRLSDEWPAENLPALIDLLCDEVTRRTPFNLKPIPWKTTYSGTQTRVRVTGANTSKPDIVDQVSDWLGSKGVERSRTEVRDALERLVR